MSVSCTAHVTRSALISLAPLSAHALQDMSYMKMGSRAQVCFAIVRILFSYKVCLIVDKHFLSDIDECLEAAVYNIELCTDNTACLNAQGGYECVCVAGYAITDGECESEL